MKIRPTLFSYTDIPTARIMLLLLPVDTLTCMRERIKQYR